MNQTERATVNAKHVRELLGGAHLQRLVRRLRTRMARGQPLSGKIQLSRATPEERAAIDKLIGRLPTQGNSLTIDLTRLAETLFHAKACERLEDAIVVLCGPVTDERLLSLSRQEAWKRLWNAACGRFAGNEAALRWLGDLKANGLLKRTAGSDLDLARTQLGQAMSLVEHAPYAAIRLAELAAQKTGNSHALDRGQPLAALVIRYARRLDESARWKTAAERRDAWEVLGVLCDELSAPVLVLNLRADGQTFTGKALNLHAAAGEPYRLSVRQLRRHPPVFDPSLCGPVVFACENPTVVDVAANKLGSSCRPIVCVDGQPKTAARLLFERLTQAGIKVRYHGDFDWDGIRIANTLIRRHGVASWRFDTSDYQAADEAEHRLNGVPVVAEWDSDLTSVMIRRGKCVHEEYVLDTLLIDLGPQPEERF